MHQCFPLFQIEIMLVNGVTAPKTGVIVWKIGVTTITHQLTRFPETALWGGMAHFMTPQASRVEQMTVLVNKFNQVPFPAVLLTNSSTLSCCIPFECGSCVNTSRHPLWVNFAKSVNRVSAAQARNGTIFDVVIVKGNDEYRNMMAQMQQELKGDRSVPYPDLDYPNADLCDAERLNTQKLTGTQTGTGTKGSAFLCTRIIITASTIT